MVRCDNCGGVGPLYRVNKKGIPGVFWCAMCKDPDDPELGELCEIIATHEGERDE